MWLIIWIEAIYFKYFKIIDFFHISFHFITSSAQWNGKEGRIKKKKTNRHHQSLFNQIIPVRAVPNIFGANAIQIHGMNFILTFRAPKLKWNWCHFEDLISKFISQISSLSIFFYSRASLQLPPQLNWIHVIPLWTAYYFLFSSFFFSNWMKTFAKALLFPTHFVWIK